MLILTFSPFSNGSITYSEDITYYGGKTIISAGRSVCEVSKLQHDEVRLYYSRVSLFYFIIF
jgi:hypothetical protein